MSKLFELSEPLSPHPFFCRFSELRCENRFCTGCVGGRGSPYARSLSHDPFLPPFPSDPCGHVTLKRNVFEYFKDHCPSLRARAAHSPMQRTQTISGRQGLRDTSASPSLGIGGTGDWSGSYQSRQAEASERKRMHGRGKPGPYCCQARLWSQTDLKSNFDLEEEGIGELSSYIGWFCTILIMQRATLCIIVIWGLCIY